MAIATSNPTVASGFWNNAPPPNTYHRNGTERLVSQALGRRSNAGLRKVMRALNGVSPGATVSDSITHIQAVSPFSISGYGGLRAMRTYTTPYDGVTTSAQQAYINANIFDAIAVTAQPYPTDLSGNGGGGKVQK